MNYVPLFKFLDWNVLLSDLFLQGYSDFYPAAILKNGNFEFYSTEERLNEIAEAGYKSALNTNFDDFQKKAIKATKKYVDFEKENIEEMDNKQFIQFLDRLFDAAKDFSEYYSKTEFPYFAKVEKEVQDYMGENSFQEVLSGKANLDSWPADKRKLAEYIKNMQHLKYKLRDSVNKLMIGETSLLYRLMNQIIKKTGREDAVEMTLIELRDCLNGKIIENVSNRHELFVAKYDKKLEFFTGKEAEDKIKEIEKQPPDKELKGNTACKGKAKGTVKIILLSTNPQKLLNKMKQGDILVSDTTGPELIEAVRKAAAIITDEGGQMSHAAIVSREFKIPCIVGTRYATKILHDGDLVEVDADKGVVRIL